MARSNVEIVRDLFKAVEAHDLEGVLRCYSPGIRIDEAPSLPYGGTFIGLDGAHVHGDLWGRTWSRLRASEASRPMTPRFFEAGEHVFVCWEHRAASGDRQIEQPVVGMYRLEGGQVVSSKMFHFDTSAILSFLRDCGADDDLSIRGARELYRALGEGDGPALARLLAPEFEGRVSTGMPFRVGGPVRSAEEMLRVWATIAKQFRVRPEPNAFLRIDDRRFVVTGFYRGYALGTKRAFEAAFAHILEFSGGLLSSLTQVTDTALWNAALEPSADA